MIHGQANAPRLSGGDFRAIQLRHPPDTVSQQGTTITAQGTAITNITARVGSAETGIAGQATAIGSLDARVTEIDGVVNAQAESFQALQASSRDDNGEGDLADAIKGWTSTAAIATEASVRTSEAEAIARRLTTFDAQIDENSANIAELEQVVATNESATATKITQLAATVGSNTAVIQETATAYADTSGKLTTMWSLKMQVNAQGQYVAAGIGLGIENTGAGLQSQFLVSADTFAVVNGINGTLSSPFAVTGGQVFIRSAFIQDLSLSFGKIADNIQSDNYVANSTGWKLSKAGGMELNSTVAGQGRVQVTNRAVKVWDANGILRVQLGDLAA